MKKDSNKHSWYKRNWFIIGMLAICFPIGLVLMRIYGTWKTSTKIIIILIFILMLSVLSFGIDSIFENLNSNSIESKKVENKNSEDNKKKYLDHVEYTFKENEEYLIAVENYDYDGDKLEAGEYSLRTSENKNGRNGFYYVYIIDFEPTSLSQDLGEPICSIGGSENLDCEVKINKGDYLAIKSFTTINAATDIVVIDKL